MERTKADLHSSIPKKKKKNKYNEIKHIIDGQFPAALRVPISIITTHCYQIFLANRANHPSLGIHRKRHPGAGQLGRSLC
jgi:hypothetical protein